LATPAPLKTGRLLSRRFRIFRLVTRTVFLIILFLFALVLGILFHPWSLALFRERINNAVERATGMSVTYEAATVRLIDGSLNLNAPRLLDPGTRQPLLGLDQIRLELPVNQLFFGGRPYEIQTLELIGPFKIELAMQRGRPILIGSSQRAWRI